MVSVFVQNVQSVVNSPNFQAVSHQIGTASASKTATNQVHSFLKSNNLTSFKDLWDILGSNNTLSMLNWVFSQFHRLTDIQIFETAAAAAELAKKIKDLIDQIKDHSPVGSITASMGVIGDLINIINNYLQDESLKIVVGTIRYTQDLINQINKLIEALSSPSFMKLFSPGISAAIDALEIIHLYIKNKGLQAAISTLRNAKDLVEKINTLLQNVKKFCNPLDVLSPGIDAIEDFLNILTTFIRSDELMLAKDVATTVKDGVKLIKDLQRIKGGPVIPDGSMLQCSCGSVPSPIKVTPLPCPVQVGGKSVAHISDCLAGVNITTFGYCQILQAVCAYQPSGTWIGLPQVNFGANASLTPFSTLNCTQGGVIRPTIFQQIVSAGKWLDALADGVKDVRKLIKDVETVEEDIKKVSK